MSQFGKQFNRKSKTKGAGNGKRKINSRDKRRSETGNYFSATKIGNEDSKARMRRRGGLRDNRLKQGAFANLVTEGGMKKVKIKTVLGSADNRNFARQKIITKGAVIDTDSGKAVVTNRPGREGFVNAKLLKE
ncbi:MAG: 30S ribosomal protein S8e [Candidatus Marsarchaeota archaeon]|jgi:small subunit ribosomal protein S8e|nr:30S ribosomal protein S8e [Candidatus Marsarchaeota archaeon]